MAIDDLVCNRVKFHRGEGGIEVLGFCDSLLVREIHPLHQILKTRI